MQLYSALQNAIRFHCLSDPEDTVVQILAVIENSLWFRLMNVFSFLEIIILSIIINTSKSTIYYKKTSVL